jgi:RHS repeat-associated protein
VGNRLLHATSTGQPLVTPATSNTVNAANQLTQFGSTASRFDSNGNLAQEGTTNTYTWDGRNRLRSVVTSAGQTTTFRYDFTGNLLSQSDSGTSLNLTKSFVLDDLTNVAYETASDGTFYSVLAGRSIDNHLAIGQSNGQTLFGLTDGINSTVATVDQTGVKQAQFLYEPYGQTAAFGAYPFQFAGRTLANASLYYNRARIYSPATGRFISEDPIGLAGGVNEYRYVSNNPVGRNDPSGLVSLSGELWISQGTGLGVGVLIGVAGALVGSELIVLAAAVEIVLILSEAVPAAIEAAINIQNTNNAISCQVNMASQ